MDNSTPVDAVARRDARAGFTLIELMIVVVIIGILAAIAIPKFTDVARGSKEAEVGPLMKQIVTLQERYAAKEGAYANDLALLEGGDRLATSGKYYDFALSGHASGFCVEALPNPEGTGAGVNPQSMDALGRRYETANCS